MIFLFGFLSCKHEYTPDTSYQILPAPSADLSEKKSSPPPLPETKNTNHSVSALNKKIFRGVCLAHNWQYEGKKGYGTAHSLEALNHLKSLGTNWVSLTPFAWMDHIHATEIKGEFSSNMPPGGESSDDLHKMVAQSRKLGFKVMLKPHIWIAKGAWRGDISPLDKAGQPAWAVWWKNYRRYILFYAELAQVLKIDIFVVGVELVNALKTHPEYFLDTIKAVRKIYKGQITYSANWDEYLDLRLWQALDYVGVQFYPPLSQKADPSLAELRTEVHKYLKIWGDIASKAQKKLLLTEVGYKSAPNAVSEPFGWPERLPKDFRKTDLEIQKLAYQALFQELARSEIFYGLFIWKYFTDKNTQEEGPYGFSPRGKPAEKIIEQAF